MAQGLAYHALARNAACALDGQRPVARKEELITRSFGMDGLGGRTLPARYRDKSSSVP